MNTPLFSLTLTPGEKATLPGHNFQGTAIQGPRRGAIQVTNLGADPSDWIVNIDATIEFASNVPIGGKEFVCFHNGEVILSGNNETNKKGLIWVFEPVRGLTYRFTSDANNQDNLQITWTQ